MRQSQLDLISKPEIKFWIPIITTIISVVLSITIWGIRLENKIDNISFQLVQNEKHNQSLTIAVNCLENDISVLDNIHGIVKCK